MYQILTVTRAYGMTNIIPSPFCFASLLDAQKNIQEQIEVFEFNDEPAEYKGQIGTLKDIFDICESKVESFDLITNEIYIYELEVR